MTQAAGEGEERRSMDSNIEAYRKSICNMIAIRSDFKLIMRIYKLTSYLYRKEV
ncbi:hypothetical protein DSECCO2_598590 [anaerobic digester metagenome]